MIVNINNVRIAHGIGPISQFSFHDLLNRTIIGDVIIQIELEIIKEENVDLIPFYFSVKDALCQTFIRGFASLIRIDYEAVVRLQPADSGARSVVVGCRDSPTRAEGNCLVSIASARKIIAAIENNMREHLFPFRGIIDEFLISDKSNAAFDLLRLIDGDVMVKSSE